MIDFLSTIAYFHDMIFGMNKMKFSLSGMTVLVFYLISLVLTPLFHHHHEEHHPGSRDNGYHSHSEPFVTPTSEHGEDDSRENATADHFDETITPFEDMVGFVQVNPESVINPAKFAPIAVLFIQSSAESCSNQLSRQNSFNLLSLQPQQDYCVLTATNLSPPQA
ncbi:MAG: hypothetical protein V3T45_00170 [Nitrospinaceae bacterium]